MKRNNNCVGELLKIFPAFVFIVANFAFMRGAQQAETPDFAFPQNVAENSDSALNHALRDGNDLKVLRSAMNLTVAKNLLFDAEVIGQDIQLWDSIIPNLKGVYKNLAYLIEADILNQGYSQKQWIYDGRNLPLNQAYPEDPEDWSGEMFKERIISLVDSASMGLDSFKVINIKEFSELLTDYTLGDKMGLNVADFIAFKGAGLLKNFTRSVSETVIPFYPEEIKKTAKGKSEEKAEALLKWIWENRKDNNSVVRAVAMQRYCILLDDSEQEKFLQSCRKALHGEEGEGLILADLQRKYGEGHEAEYYRDISSWLSKYPDGYNASDLRNIIREMTQEQIEVSFPNIALPDTKIKGTLEVSNLSKGYLLIYRLSSGQADQYDNLIIKKFSGTSKPNYSVPFTTQGEIPYTCTQDIELPALPEGLYAIIPSKTTTPGKNWKKEYGARNIATIRVTEIGLLSCYESTNKNSGGVYVVKGKDQEPVTGARVAYYKGENKNPQGRVTTDKNGFAPIPQGYYHIEATYGRSMAKMDAGFSYYSEEARTVYHADIFTDLGVYRPGDTIKFVVVGWKQENKEIQLVKGQNVELQLRDANYLECGKINLTLDDAGRATGEFEIPQGRLLGNYQLVATYPSHTGAGSGYASVLVEEYKLPAFNVVIEQESGDSENLLKFKGEAKTYSGMPVTGGKVDIKVEYIPWRWGIGGRNANYSFGTETNGDGEFEFDLPTSNLKGTIFEQGRYGVTAEVTSPAGETEKSSSLIFFLGKGIDIRPQISDKTEIKGDTVKFHVPVYDMAGLPQNVTLDYRFINYSDTTKNISGEFISPLLALPSSSLPSGKYKLEFKGKEKDTNVVTETVIWRPDDRKAPFATPLWVPVTEYVYSEENNKIDICFGSSQPEWILLVESDGEKEITREWIKPSEELIKYSVPIKGDSTLFINLNGMCDFNGETAQIRILSAKSLEKMEVSSLSFRENISAGSSEEWQFRFKIGNRIPEEVNAFAVMSDKALNAIRNFTWNFNIFKPQTYNKFRVNLIRSREVMSFRNFPQSQRPEIYKSYGALIPDWQTYGYPFLSSRVFDYGMPVMYRSMKSAATNAITESMMAKEESAEEMEDSVSVAEVPAAPASGADESQGMELRPVELPLAFFMPDLKTDDEGVLDIKFTVPNYNTTWQLQVAGYADNLMNSTLLLDAVASKEVMVKSNLSRYLRTGDKAVIEATLYNNSSETRAIGGKLEILDAETEEILAVKNFEEEELQPSGNRVISINYIVPDNLPLLVFRAYANGDYHTDGEQGYIPVLPSSTPVIESKVFYAVSEDKNIEVKLPKMRKSDNVTFKYCNNPLWEVLLSLPSPEMSDGESALSLSNWLFNTLVSSKIINGDDKITAALRRIFESNDSSLTESKLQKDSRLKLTDLVSTPWINNANSETLKIRNLEKYLDASFIDGKKKLKIESLEKLQNSDGGFSWFPGMKSSRFITEKVVSVLGYLNQLGIEEESLKMMARNAVRYLDGNLKESVEKTGKISVIPTMDYLYIRNMTGVKAGESVKKIESQTLDSIAKYWRYWDEGSKAKGATLLMTSSGHLPEVEDIARSLEQFLNRNLSLKSESLILELYGKIGDHKDAIDRINQKMYLQKETRDWNKEPEIAGVIYAMLSTVDKIDTDRTKPQVFLGDTLLDLPDDESLLGSYTVELNPMEASGKKIYITREEGIPAWGGIVVQYVAPIKDVKEAKSENLSVTKNLYIEDSKGNVKEVTSFHKGDKVKVVISINCKKDMDYVVIKDNRSATLQPDDKLSGMIIEDGNFCYREIGKESISFFIENLRAGKYVISYDCHADREGEYSLGITQVQSLYSPTQTAHSKGSVIRIQP